MDVIRYDIFTRKNIFDWKVLLRRLDHSDHVRMIVLTTKGKQPAKHVSFQVLTGCNHQGERSAASPFLPRDNLTSNMLRLSSTWMHFLHPGYKWRSVLLQIFLGTFDIQVASEWKWCFPRIWASNHVLSRGQVRANACFQAHCLQQGCQFGEVLTGRAELTCCDACSALDTPKHTNIIYSFRFPLHRTIPEGRKFESWRWAHLENKGFLVTMLEMGSD